MSQTTQELRKNIVTALEAYYEHVRKHDLANWEDVSTDIDTYSAWEPNTSLEMLGAINEEYIKASQTADELQAAVDETLTDMGLPVALNNPELGLDEELTKEEVQALAVSIIGQLTFAAETLYWGDESEINHNIGLMGVDGELSFYRTEA